MQPSRKGMARNVRRRQARLRAAAQPSNKPIEKQQDGMTQNFLRVQTPVTVPRLTHFGARSKWLLIPSRRQGMAALLTQLEEDQASKMGPRNLYEPAKLRDAILKFMNLSSATIDPYVAAKLEGIAEKLHRDLHLPHVRLEKEHALSMMLMKEKTTSAGYPFFKSREVVCANYLPQDFAEANPDRYAKDIDGWEKLGRPDILSVEPIPTYLVNYRTEAGKTGPKVRLVFAAPMANQILEAQYAIPIQDALSVLTSSEDAKHGSVFSYMNPILLHASIMNIVAWAEENGTKCTSLDYAAFDAHIGAQMIVVGFIVLFGPKDNWNEEQRQIVDNFINKKLLTPWGVYEFHGGVPSGSIYTNLVDTAVNAVAADFVAGEDRAVVGRYNGDDAAIAVAPYMTPEQFEVALAKLGLEANAEKQAVSDNSFTFNKAYHGWEYQGRVPSENRVINSMRYYDSQMKGINPDGKALTVDQEILRSLQLVLLMEFHPHRVEFLREVAMIVRDGTMMLDYRKRLPIALDAYDESDIPFVVPSVKELDNSWLAEIYELGD